MINLFKNYLSGTWGKQLQINLCISDNDKSPFIGNLLVYLNYITLKYFNISNH